MKPGRFILLLFLVGCAAAPPPASRYPHCLKASDCNSGQACVSQLCTSTTSSNTQAYKAPDESPVAIDKEALLASMKGKTEALSSTEKTVQDEKKAVVRERVKLLPGLIPEGTKYEVADDDLFVSTTGNNIVMFEMTTEQDYCYIIAAVAEPQVPVLIAAFRDQQSLAVDFGGKDIAKIEFCSTVSAPIKFTATTTKPTAVAIRVYYASK